MRRGDVDRACGAGRRLGGAVDRSDSDTRRTQIATSSRARDTDRIRVEQDPTAQVHCFGVTIPRADAHGSRPTAARPTPGSDVRLLDGELFVIELGGGTTSWTVASPTLTRRRFAPERRGRWRPATTSSAAASAATSSPVAPVTTSSSASRPGPLRGGDGTDTSSWAAGPGTRLARRRSPTTGRSRPAANILGDVEVARRRAARRRASPAARAADAERARRRRHARRRAGRRCRQRRRRRRRIAARRRRGRRRDLRRRRRHGDSRLRTTSWPRTARR